MKKIIILIISIFCLTGCANYHELNELGIVSSILIDYKDNLFYTTVEIVDEEEFKIYSGVGNSLTNALDNTLIGSSKYLYYSHLNAVILSENTPIDTTLDYFLRSPEINNTFYTCITEKTDIYNKDENIGETLKNILERVYKDNSFNTIKKLKDKNTDFVLPIVDENLKVSKLNLYKNSKKVATLNNNEFNTLKLLFGHENIFIKNGKEKYIEININKIKKKIDIKDKIKISLDLEATIKQITTDEEANNVKDLQNIQGRYNKELENNIYELIDKLKEYKTDVLGINNMLLNKFHSLDKHFYDYSFEIDVKTHINKKGLLIKWKKNGIF